MVERFFRDITMHLCDGSFSSVRELEASITALLAQRNAQPIQYVWSVKMGRYFEQNPARPRGNGLTGERGQ